MSTAEAPAAEPKTERRRARFRGRSLFVLAILLVACAAGYVLRHEALPLSWTADYDRARYNEIRRAIDADPNHLAGKPFDEISRRFGLEDVPWDDGAVQQESGMFRIYHFRGFSLHLTLRRLPPGSTPDRVEPWTGDYKDLLERGLLWVGPSYPALWVDGISDPKARMDRYWKEVQEMCDRMNAEMDQERQRDGR
jgi:hypothetical protein